VLLPRPYPQFLPYFHETAVSHAGPRPAEFDGLQFTIGADLFEEDDLDTPHGFQIERVVLDTRR
jgi:hypothetical protein